MKSIKKLPHLLLLAGLGLLSASCSDQLEDVQPNSSLSAASEQAASANSITMNTVPFTATAMIASCHGENIMFSGMIENRVKKTMSASGKSHFFRQFTVKGLTGIGLTTGTVYDVVGGAEMFSIKDPVYNADGSLNLPASLRESDIVIHRGTLVFVSREDGSRVVARHIITKVPGQGLKTNTWDCGGN